MTCRRAPAPSAATDNTVHPDQRRRRRGLAAAVEARGRRRGWPTASPRTSPRRSERHDGDRAYPAAAITARACRCRPMPPPTAAGVDLPAAMSGRAHPAARRPRAGAHRDLPSPCPAASRRRCGRAPAWRCKHGRHRAEQPGHHRCRLSRRDRRHPDQSRQRALRHPARRAHRPAGDRPGARVAWQEAATSSESVRGAGGFGSTGHARGRRRLRRHGIHRQPVRTLCPPSDPRRSRRRGTGASCCSRECWWWARAGSARRCCSISPPPASARSASSMTIRSTLEPAAAGDPHDGSVGAAESRERGRNCWRGSIPDVKVIPTMQRLTADNAAEIIGGYDLVADGSDNFATRFLLNDACYLAGKTLVSAALFVSMRRYRFQGPSRAAPSLLSLPVSRPSARRSDPPLRAGRESSAPSPAWWARCRRRKC